MRREKWGWDGKGRQRLWLYSVEMCSVEIDVGRCGWIGGWMGG